MEEIHQNLPPRDFPRPSGLVNVVVCLDSGQRATDACRSDPRGNRARTEVFASQHAPRADDYCTVHVAVVMCETGYIAGEFCPPETVVEIVGLVRPFPIDHIPEAVADRVHELPDGARLGIVCSIHTELYFLTRPDEDDEYGFGEPPEDEPGGDQGEDD